MVETHLFFQVFQQCFKQYSGDTGAGIAEKKVNIMAVGLAPAWQRRRSGRRMKEMEGGG